MARGKGCSVRGARRGSSEPVSRLGDHTLGSSVGSTAGGIAGRCGGRGDSGASSVSSTIGGSNAAGGTGADGMDVAICVDMGLDLARSQSSGPGAGSLAVAGKWGSGARGSGARGSGARGSGARGG